MAEATPPIPAPGGLARWQSLLIGTAIFLGITVYAAGVFAIDVLVQGASDGVVMLLWLLAGYGYGRGLLDRCLFRVPRFGTPSRVLPTEDTAWSTKPWHPEDDKKTFSHEYTGDGTRGLLAVTATALGLGVIGLLTLSLGLAGLESRVAAWAIIGIGVAIALNFCRDHSFRDLKPWLITRSPGASVAWLLAIPLAITFVGASVSPGWLWKPLDPHPYDVTSYHLQIPREWFDAGRILPLKHNSFSFFPMGMEMHYLTAMRLLGGPWAGMYLCQFMSLAHGGLTVLTVIAVCRSFGVGPVLSRLCGLMTACVPWVLMLSSVCYVEPGVMLYTLLAAAWAGRALHRQPVLATILGGAFAGLACGMKYTAFAMTAIPLIALWPIVAGKVIGWRRVFVPTLAAAVACAVVVSPWLIRNVMWSGNPVFPLAASLFGQGHFTDDEVDRYRIAHSPPVAEQSVQVRLVNGYHRIVIDPQYGYLLLPAAIAAAILIRRRPERMLLVILLMAMAGVWLFATHDMPRFLTPAIPLAAVLVGLAMTGGPAIRWGGGAVMILAAVIGVGWTWNELADFLPKAQQGLFRLSDLSIIETDETKAARTSGDKVAMIGDAQAFFYVAPSDRVIYRSVFDVNIPPGTSLVDGWHGKSVDALRRDGYWVVINTSELDRLSRSYAHLPRSAPPYDVVQPTPIVLPPIR